MCRRLAPVVVFAYNRADKLENCIKNLEKCPEAAESELFVFCDGPKGDRDRVDVENVRLFLDQYSDKSLFKSISIFCQDKNRGLAASIIQGVTEVVNRYGRVIVVEDDNIVLPSFLSFLNEGLEYYEQDMKCGSISAFTYPMSILKGYDHDIFATRKAECSGGWATWSNRWNDAKWADTDFESYLNDPKLRWEFERLEAGLDRLMYLQYKGKIDSWAVRWVYYLFREGKLTVYPSKGQVINDGFDGRGTHSAKGSGAVFRVPYSDKRINTEWEECHYDKEMAKAYAIFPRRFLPLYVLETIRYMLKKK